MSKRDKNDIQSSNWKSSAGTGVCRIDHKNLIDNSTTEFSSEALEEIRKAIKNKYAEVAISATGKFEYPTGKDGAYALRYDPSIIHKASPNLVQSFCGVGNPFSLGKIRNKDVVLDFGSGAGFDLFVASSLVGENGRAFGVDLTRQMVELSQNNLADANISNVEIKQVDSENIPYADNSFDIVISNGVINLSPSKSFCFREIYRVLKPGGRLQFADVVSKNEMPSNLSGSLEAWSQWIGGTIPVGDQINLLEEAGFQKVEYVGETGFRTSKYTVGALFRAIKPQ